MARKVEKIGLEIEDVNGSFARLMDEAPKVARRFLSTAVFSTAAAIQRHMEELAPLGPDDEGLTPGEHIKFDIEHRGRNGALSAQVGIFDDENQVKVAVFNEYAPNRHAFMRPSAEAEAGPFIERAKLALQQCERFLSHGW